MATSHDLLAPLDTFERRHTGSAPAALAEMLRTVGYESLDALADAAVPAAIRLKRPLRLPAAAGDVAGQFVGPCDLMRRTADVVEHIAPALANGGIGPDDGLPLLVEARKDVRLLHGACATLDAQIAAALCQLAAEADRRVQ